MVKNLEMVIFDLDGTLWETTDTTYESANEVMRKYNVNHEITKEAINGAMGKTFAESAYTYMPHIEEKQRLFYAEEIHELNSKKLSTIGGNVFPNLENVLIELRKKYKIAIVSNCGANYIEAFLESSKLGKYFEDFIAASKMKIAKSEAIKLILERNNINTAIYIGDTIRDLKAAQGAEIDFIHAKYGFEPNLETRYHINNLMELPNLLERIFTEK